MTVPTLINNSTKQASWPATSTITVSRPGTSVTTFDGMMVASIVIGRAGGGTVPALNLPTGWVLDAFEDHSDDPTPSSFAICHKSVTASSAEPSSYVFGVTPARTMNVIAFAVRNALGISVTSSTDYLGTVGDPQYVRDPSVLRTPFRTSGGLLQVRVGAFTGFGIYAELTTHEYRHSAILGLDHYSTSLWGAGNYYVAVFPFSSDTWNPLDVGDGPLVDLRITRTLEEQVVGARDPTLVPTAAFSDDISLATNLVDPSIGTTLVRSDFSGYVTSDPTDPDEFADWSDDRVTKGRTGWVKITLTSPAWLALDTYHSTMFDQVMYVFDHFPTTTSTPVFSSDDTPEFPYYSTNPFSGTEGIFGKIPVHFPDIQAVDFYAQQALLNDGHTNPLELVFARGDINSPRRLGWSVLFAGGTLITLRWPYIPGTVLLNGSAVDVTEVDPATGLIQIVDQPGAYTLTYEAAGTSAFGTGTGSSASENDSTTWASVAVASGSYYSGDGPTEYFDSTSVDGTGAATGTDAPGGPAAPVPVVPPPSGGTAGDVGTGGPVGEYTGGGTPPTLPSSPVIRSFSGTQSQFEALLSDMSIDVIEMAAGTYHNWHVYCHVSRASRPLFIRPAPGAAVIWDNSGGGSGSSGLFYFGANTGSPPPNPAEYIVFDPAGTGGSFTIQNYDIGDTGLIYTGWVNFLTLNGFRVRNCSGTASGTSSHGLYISTDGTHRAHNITANNWDIALVGARTINALQTYHNPNVDTLMAADWRVSGCNRATYLWSDALNVTILRWTIVNCNVTFDTAGSITGTISGYSTTNSGPTVRGSGQWSALGLLDGGPGSGATS